MAFLALRSIEGLRDLLSHRKREVRLEAIGAFLTDKSDSVRRAAVEAAGVLSKARRVEGRQFETVLRGIGMSAESVAKAVVPRLRDESQGVRQALVNGGSACRLRRAPTSFGFSATPPVLFARKP